MDAIQWTLEAILKDGECCGNCIGCKKEFAQCAEFVVEEEVG